MRLVAVGGAIFALTVIACSNSTTSPTPSSTTSTPPTTPSGTMPTATNATLNVMLKDGPFVDAKALLITFSNVSAHLSGGDFTSLPFVGGASSRTCDLEKLTTAQDVLGTGPLPAGHYTQIRLVVTNATIYFDNASTGAACSTTIAAPAGRNAAVTIPSGEVKLNREFDLTATNATTMLLDFDGDQSVKETGNGRYMMTPVINIVSVQ
jgi:hypothetical protein